MPELPEVETVRRILENEVVGKTIQKVDVLYNLIDTNKNDFIRSLQGETIEKLGRTGKFLEFHLSNNKVVVSHLRMEGKYFVLPNDTPLTKHDHVIFYFTDGATLRYNDVRKFGRMGLYDECDYKKTSPINKLGKEPFELTPKELYEGLRNKKGPIKEALLDQTLISGLGNIYDDEVLFATKINPLEEANKITLKQCEGIIKESIRILNSAIDNGGSTIRSYHPKEGVSGRMQVNLLAYGRGGKPCLRCGFPLKKISVGGRGTVYCPICQRLEGKGLKVIVTGAIHSGKTLVTEYLESKGFDRVDCDKIVASLYKDENVKSGLTALFGKEVIKDGKVDKPFIGAKIKEDKKLKKELNSFIHPLVKEEVEKELLKLNGNIIIEVPLLVGSGLEKCADYIIYIESNDGLREKRIEKQGRNAKVLMGINADYPFEKTKKIANVIITNDGDKLSLYKELDKLPIF